MKSFFFDLDNTLYDANQYFSSAFLEVAEYLSKRCNTSKKEIYEKLMNLWEIKTSMYPHLFDDLLDNIGVECELESVIKIFNNHDCKLIPYQDIIPTLEELKNKKCVIGLITDGNVVRQKRKIKSLGLIDFFNVMVYTNETNNPKPSEIPFIEAINNVRANPQDSYYIGDNPIIDFMGAKKVGMATIRIRRGEFRNYPTNEYIDYEIKDSIEIIDFIK